MTIAGSTCSASIIVEASVASAQEFRAAPAGSRSRSNTDEEDRIAAVSQREERHRCREKIIRSCPTVSWSAAAFPAVVFTRGQSVTNRTCHEVDQN